MDDEPQLLPPKEELEQVFRDFKKVLHAARYKTPLQRAQLNVTRKSCIALFQKAESEAERVFNLLPPGHRTRLKVDFLRKLLSSELSIFLRVPISLLSDGKKVVLVKNNSLGQVTVRQFTEMERGFQSFVEEVAKCGPFRPYLPKFVHKSEQNVTSFHSSAREALSSWTTDGSAVQQLQQYVQPYSGSHSIVRVHWKSSQQSICYFIAHGPQKEHLPSLVHNPSVLSRSFSESSVHCTKSSVHKSPSNLIVQRAKIPAHLAKAVETVLKVLGRSLADGEKLTEVVCDFTSDQTHQWVFLACKGFTFRGKQKLRTETMSPCQPINLSYLMYPVIARRAQVQKKLQWTNKLKAIAAEHKLSVAALMKSMNDYVPLPFADSDGEQSPKPVGKSGGVLPSAFFRSSESEFLTREVSRFDRLMLGSRKSRIEASEKVDFVEKCGGAECWKPLIRSALARFHKHAVASSFGLEDMGCEELNMKVNALLRVIRGDYNFYYHEALRRVHAQYSIKKSQYQQFLSELRPALAVGTQCAEDAAVLFQRFSSFEEFICRQSPAAPQLADTNSLY